MNWKKKSKAEMDKIKKAVGSQAMLLLNVNERLRKLEDEHNGKDSSN